MDNKQSSVDAIMKFMKENGYFIGNDLYQFFEQAKAMHKSEIIWAHGIKMKGVNNHKCVNGEQYYNETFGDESNN